MKSCEKNVAPESEYFVYSPSRLAEEMFFYPLQCGHFLYQAGYSLHRESYDSFLLMYVQKGSLTLRFEEKTTPVSAGQFLLLDCYRPHAYSSEEGWECLWCHFDGVLARPWYDSIVSRLGNAFALPDSSLAKGKLAGLWESFASGSPVREPLISKYLADILTAFLLHTPEDGEGRNHSGMAEDILSYVNEHFSEDIPIERLAEKAGLSQYHFIRTFKRETGFTPHEYIVHVRISTAKYLLKNTQLPVKSICFSTGFSSESVFCSSFKKQMGMTPGEYRAFACHEARRAE